MACAGQTLSQAEVSGCRAIRFKQYQRQHMRVREQVSMHGMLCLQSAAQIQKWYRIQPAEISRAGRMMLQVWQAKACRRGAHRERGPLWLQNVERLDVGPCGADQLVVVVKVLLGKRRLPLPCAVYLDDLHHTLCCQYKRIAQHASACWLGAVRLWGSG